MLNYVIDETLLGRLFKYSTITVGTASQTLKFLLHAECRRVQEQGDGLI
jgi:hypothetical protein